MRIILNKVVDTNTTQGTKPYKQSWANYKTHFTCPILLYAEEYYKTCHRDHHYLICKRKQKLKNL